MDPLESFARYTPDAHRYEHCPRCKQCTLRWSHRWPEEHDNRRKALQTQWYLCANCGLIPLNANLDATSLMRRCWHCARWGLVGRMWSQASIIGANRSGRNINYFCDRRCALRELLDEQREQRLMGKVSYCKGLVYKALRKFLED